MLTSFFLLGKHLSNQEPTSVLKERKYLLTLPPSYPELHCYSPRFEKIFTSVVAVAAVEEADDVK
jgi:hypothetical protein